MSATVLGRKKWSCTRTEKGREYKLLWRVKCSDYADGPQVALSAAGLASVGAEWSYGNDNDPWAFCLPTASARPVVDDEKCKYWDVEQTFSTIPLKRCQDQDIEDPLNEPPRISGSAVRYLKEAQKNRQGKYILSSSHEQITGIQKDAGRPSVIVELNSLDLDAEIGAMMQDTLNDSPLWGLGERKIKMTWPSWERRIYGTCSFYYIRRFEFEIRYEGFDLIDVADAGFKKYRGSPLPDTPENRANPKNYIVAKDVQGENSPQKILLNGNGEPLEDPTNPVFLPTIELYDESNFYLLGIPSYL